MRNRFPNLSKFLQEINKPKPWYKRWWEKFTRVYEEIFKNACEMCKEEGEARCPDHGWFGSVDMACVKDRKKCCPDDETCCLSPPAT